MSIQEITSTNNLQKLSISEKDQYTIWQILGVWALAALPMAILSWVVFPAVSSDFNSDPFGAGVTRIMLLTVGLIWLFVLSMIIVRNEEGDLRWATIKRRLHLNAPQDPTTSKSRRRLWLWVIPFIIAFPSLRFRSTWMGVIIHSVENMFGGLLTLGIILGLA